MLDASAVAPVDAAAAAPVDAAPDDAPSDDSPPDDTSPDMQPAPPGSVPRLRRPFLVALVVALVAWSAGLVGAWMGVRLANHDRVPARVASTLGLVTIEPRKDPLPTMDVFTVAATIAPSVVNVTAITKDGELVGESTGTGVVLTADGEIITNAHVVEGAVTVSVRVPGESEPRGAVVLASDPGRDLALLRIDADRLVPAAFADPGDIRVGDDVVAVGYALDLDGDPSVTVGIVSALDRSSADTTKVLKGLIQTDAPISSGNSGGPLVNSLGQVVGITTFIAVTEQGVTANNLGFAISNAELLPEIDVLRAATGGELPAAGFLGVNLSDRLDGGSGALVAEVVKGSPAEAAGVRAGDAIVGVNGDVVTGRAGLAATIRDARPGDELTLDVRRGGKTISLRATLTARPAE